MKHNKEVKISYWAAHLTTIVSVTLVLIIIGVIALITVGASRETRRLREKLEVSVVMADSVSDSSAATLARVIASRPYALNVKTISRDEALSLWKADTGEDLEALFGVNPLSPEVSFSVAAEYGGAAALDKIDKELSEMDGVEGVALPDSSMVESMNRNIERFAIVLGVIAAVLIIISFVLINNTVHLAIYAKRFTIHTMQLVGATNGFIRRPFVADNLLCGLVSGLVASGLLAAAFAGAPQAGFDDVDNFISWADFAVVAGGLAVIGMALCALAAGMATSRYLGKDYDELFR